MGVGRGCSAFGTGPLPRRTVWFTSACVPPSGTRWLRFIKSSRVVWTERKSVSIWTNSLVKLVYGYSPLGGCGVNTDLSLPSIIAAVQIACSNYKDLAFVGLEISELTWFRMVSSWSTSH
jgi:hypothetical protein